MWRNFFKRFFLLLGYYVLWMFFFTVLRLAFLVFNWRMSTILPLREWLLVLYHGLPQDISVSSYILVIPVLLMALSFFIRDKWLIRIFSIYSGIVLGIVCLVAITDLELYPFWNFRLDATPLLYIDHPREMLASVSLWVVLRQLVIGTVLFAIFWFPFRYLVRKYGLSAGTAGILDTAIFLLLAGLLIIPIRGGLDVAPMNVGAVYFSKNTFSNHAAVNVAFNLGYALANLESEKNPYLFTDATSAKQVKDSLFECSCRDTTHILTTERPNIIVILLESFTAKVIGSCGGAQGITPNFDRYAKEGLLFTNAYSSGDRSDKGIVAVVSGYPALPTLSVIKYPRKTQHLPFISRDLKKLGYSCYFFHGGDVDFANMRSFFTNGGFDRIISKSDFSPRDFNAKWGVHDHVVFDTLSEYLNKARQPFFYMYFTLSSHEPFDVPMRPLLPGNSPDVLFMNAVHYSDSCLGDFLDRSKKQDWWKNTLVILVADHGSRHPGYQEANDYRRYHIGMLWLGGALRKKGVVSQIVAQTDIAGTLMHQMDLPDSAYHFGQDIFDPSCRPFAMFFFNDGFGFVNDSLHYAYDNKLKQVSASSGKYTPKDVFAGRAFLQYVYDDFVKK